MSAKQIEAFVEFLCPHAAIVRAGPHALQYRDKFDFAVAVKIEGDRAIIKGLVAPRLVVWWLRWLFPVRRFTRAHKRAADRALAKYGLKPEWERHKTNWEAEALHLEVQSTQNSPYPLSH